VTKLYIHELAGPAIRPEPSSVTEGRGLQLSLPGMELMVLRAIHIDVANAFLIIAWKHKLGRFRNRLISRLLLKEPILK